MSNINRDYLIILDVKSGEVDSPNIYYFNTDKNTSNLYVQMVLRETNIEATPIDNANNYSIKANILKPNMVGKIVEGNLVNEEKAIYEFKLPADCTDFSGNAKIEFEVYCTVDGVEEIATSFATKFKVHGSVLTEQNKYIEDSSDYPILKELMAEAKELNTQAKELNTDSRKLHEELSGALEAEEQRKANESDRIANENARQATEATRISNENTRAGAEATRISNENTRQSNEASREAAEQTRQTNENARIANENARREAETARAGAEATRVTAENERIAKENLRIEAEADRVTAEQAREANNTAMRQDITNMQNEISNFETATNREIEGIRTSVGQEIDTMKVIVENQNAKIDYIKENDRKQDILINGIFNSQDGKLTSTKEDNIHDLVESKPGLLYVDNITGNTMVNCNKEADKSIVLTEAINEEGTNNITLTQGVDGAKADVYVEGNTMVNVCDQEEAVAITTNTNTFPLRYLYASTNYILQFESDTNVTIDITLGGYTLSSQNIAVGLNKINITTPDTLTDNNLVLDGVGFNASNIVVTEATDKEFGYFQGLKSVGELEENKIEILSNNKNLITRDNLVQGQIYTNGTIVAISDKTKYYTKDIIKLPKGYAILSIASGYKFLPCIYNSNKEFIRNLGWFENNNSAITVNENYAYLRVEIRKSDNTAFTEEDLNSVQLQLEQQPNWTTTPTDYVIGKSNKKQIILNEPLRAVGDTKDRFVQIDGKWYVERNVGEIVFDGSSDERWMRETNDSEGWARYKYLIANSINDTRYYNTNKYFITDKYKTRDDKTSKACMLYSSNAIFYEPSVSNLDGFKAYINQNPITCIYALASPTYEPIDYNPLDIYSDTTHISINSNIPAKLKVRNHGYNCMVKPSTTYTATYSIDGVAQKTTIVTPATLDDSTRFTGTGTLSNFLLLEGDISNPPEFFVGMRSSFDQEYDEVKGKWKVNIRVEGNDTYNDITIYINEPLREGDILKAENRKILVERHMGERDYQEGDYDNYITDGVRTVYPLAEPVIEEVETDYTRLMLESYENATVYFNSHIPPVSTIRYQANVISTAEIMSVNDEQDSMIIDNATQIAMITLTM